MTDSDNSPRTELERIKRVSDQLCTAHAALRDRYQCRLTILEVAVLLSSAWLTALAFLDPRLTAYLVPFDWEPRVWIGILGVTTFSLTLLQLRLDWRGKIEGHGRSLKLYSEIKRESAYLLASHHTLDDAEVRSIAMRYEMISDVGTDIPESEFLSLKQRHKLKVEISKMLDHRPASSIALLRVRLFLRDNCPCRRR